jgi:glycosyltransferase involved in cell wall biosynthesis
MTGMTAAKNALMNVRRQLSQRFWKAWQDLPISQSDRARTLRFVFKRLPFLVSWSASYRNWTADSAREAAQLAKIAEFRKAAESRPEGRSARYVDPSSLPRPDHLIARAIAFYLPQFHAIPENDRWWGKGFTEWTNVRRARPQFQGHRQPRRPGELGYYDLGRDTSIRRRQAALAHQYGLEGFCFYFYWFGGKTLLEAPIKAWAQDEEINFPFCLCWANESWSRRWDGREDQKLIVQYHSPEDDIAFIRHISDYLNSDKYLRIDGRPLIVVYRPDKLPDAQATAKRWREWCRQNGVGEIYLAYTLSFAEGTPQQYGFDAAIEFPPNNMGLSQHSGLVEPTSDDFAARIYDLQELALRSASHDKPRMKLFRGVAPQWDNTARRMHNAAIMLDGGPSTYELWLSNAARQTAEMHSNPDERLVFINAWNEWAEGAYLEPDLDRGYAWLEATRRALIPPSEHKIEPAELVPAEPMIVVPARHKVIVVVHDLWRNGAQFLALNLVATYVMKFGCEVVTIACGDGPLAANFEWYGRLIRVSQLTTPSEKLDEICSDLYKQGFSAAVVNSVASGWVTPHLAKAGIRCVGLVHEMPDIIRKMQLETGVRAFDEHAASIVFSSERLKQSTGQSILRGDWTRGTIIPQGLYKAESILSLDEKQAAANDIRGRFGLPENALIVLGVAYGDHRKGVDIFCKWAIAAARRDSKFHFLWVGDLSSDMQIAGGEILANSGDVAGNVHFTGFKHDIATFYKAAHAYALSSREDPFPSTVLDALACGTPAFVVDGTTGLTELRDCPAIRVLPDADPDTFADALAKLTSAPSKYRDAARSGIALIRERFGFTSYAGDVLRLAGQAQPRISVVIPNYNYARHLPHRIATILNQDQPVWEIIFLDDASTDDSLQVAERLLQDCGISYRIVPNKKNSGSVFAQWKKGVDLARGDIVWIAEADDWTSARFTAVASEAFSDPDVLVSYTQSNQVNADGEIVCPHYLDYVADIDRERWRRPYVSETGSEIDLGLAIKNTIPNVSGVLFRRSALSAVLEEHMREIRTYRVAGDWCCYLHLARRGRIAFDPRPLNYHRRHGDSVTVSRFTQAEFDEIAQLQRRAQVLGDVSSESLCKSQAYLEALRGML